MEEVQLGKKIGGPHIHSKLGTFLRPVIPPVILL
jgi:hypothetical protein